MNNNQKNKASNSIENPNNFQFLNDSNEELMNIEGGMARSYFYGIIVSAVTFLIGLVDGLIRPLSCND